MMHGLSLRPGRLAPARRPRTAPRHAVWRAQNDRDPLVKPSSPGIGRRHLLGSALAGGLASRLLEPTWCRTRRPLPRLPRPDERQDRLRLALEARLFEPSDAAALVGDLYDPKAVLRAPFLGAQSRDAMVQRLQWAAWVGYFVAVRIDETWPLPQGAGARGQWHWQPLVGPDVRLDFVAVARFDGAGRIVAMTEGWTP